MAYKVKGIKDVQITESDASTTDLPFGNTLTMEPEYTTIEFEGDGETDEEYMNQRLSGQIGGDKFDETVLEALYGKSAVTSGTGIDGVESKRYYMMEDAELTPNNVELQIDLYAVDDSDDSAAEIRITVFKAQIKPFSAPDGANAEKWAPILFDWEAQKTTTDIEDGALPEVPTGGAYYAISILA